ncbi:MAG: ribonuclease J [Clostridia bacterium]|nr:ribonuclease J [Clostridia bacterium]
MANKNQLDDIRASIDALKSNKNNTAKNKNKTQNKKPKSQEISSKGNSKPKSGKNSQKRNSAKKGGSNKKIKKTEDTIKESVKNSAVNKAEMTNKKSANKNSAKNTQRKTDSRKKKKITDGKPLKIIFLGGLNEVGKNMTLYEYNDEIIIVDCGLAFPEPDMLGVDIVIPDFSYVEKNISKVKGIFITHGHEDHIGGLAYLLNVCNIPVYSTRLTLGLIEGKLKEHNILSSSKLNEVKPGDTVKAGAFSVEMIHVNHSIPDAIGLAITCGAGTVIQTGDFKIDSTPIDGGMIDLARFADLGNKGVLALLSDSTNAERPGFTESERKVGDSFEILFRRAGKKRIIVATFASNIHRIQQIINVAHSIGRKVAVVGRSLENVVSISAELGYLNIPEGVLIKDDSIKNYTSDKLVIITTGSQGEPMSALTRMAFSDHRKVEIRPDDYVIISATPIPGNEKTVGNVVNELMKLGATVIYEKMYDVHVSGHACQEELKLMLGITKPKYFIPVHGEQKHLLKHAGLAEAIGISKKNIVIADNGSVVELSSSAVRFASPVQAGNVFVDGSGVGDVGSVVLRNRKHLGEDGIIVVTAALDYETGQLISGPDVISRGFVYVKESEELISAAKKVAEKALENCYYSNISDISAIKGKLKDAVSKYVHEQTKRDPVILPVILEV